MLIFFGVEHHNIRSTIEAALFKEAGYQIEEFKRDANQLSTLILTDTITLDKGNARFVTQQREIQIAFKMDSVIKPEDIAFFVTLTGDKATKWSGATGTLDDPKEKQLVARFWYHSRDDEGEVTDDALLGLTANLIGISTKDFEERPPPRIKAAVSTIAIAILGVCTGSLLLWNLLMWRTVESALEKASANATQKE